MSLLLFYGTLERSLGVMMRLVGDCGEKHGYISRQILGRRLSGSSAKEETGHASYTIVSAPFGVAVYTDGCYE